ncbi:MAG: putative thiosulfate sulfurtransferase [Candidatus Hydrogenedentota bacterium]
MLAFAFSLLVVALPPEQLLLSATQAQGLANVLFVDARPLDDYAAGHIPGAVQVDAYALSEERDGVVGLLGPFIDIATALGMQGVDPTRHIVVYSGFERPDDVKRATRLFWILEYMGYERVSLLDGGLAKWKADGLSLETGAKEPVPVSTESLKPQEDRLATLDEVKARVKIRQGLADFRSEEEFSGAKQAKSASKAGHIPSAVNLPESTFVEGPSNTFISVESIEKMLGAKGLGKSEPVIAYCNTGRSASVGYFVLRLTGHDVVELYDGSMSEWTARDQEVECPVDLDKGQATQEK